MADDSRKWEVMIDCGRAVCVRVIYQMRPLWCVCVGDVLETNDCLFK